MSNKKCALVVCDGDHQGATQAYHEVAHGEAEDQNVHWLEERRIPQHHGYDQTVVKHRQNRVDEHEERKYTVAHARENCGLCGGQLASDGGKQRA